MLYPGGFRDFKRSDDSIVEMNASASLDIIRNKNKKSNIHFSLIKMEGKHTKSAPYYGALKMHVGTYSNYTRIRILHHAVPRDGVLNGQTTLA